MNAGNSDVNNKQTNKRFKVARLALLILVAFSLVYVAIACRDLLRWQNGYLPQTLSEKVEQCGIAAQYASPNESFSLMLPRNGMYAPKNFEDAFKWCREAAEQGDPDAQAVLAEQYRTGRKVSQDWSEAYFWQILSSNGGYKWPTSNPVDKHSVAVREEIKSHLTAEQADAIYKRINLWKPTPAAPPSTTSEKAEQCNIAGHATVHDPNWSKWVKSGHYVSGHQAGGFDEAYNWCLQAANEGDAGAQITIGALNEVDVTFVPKNYSEARNWYRKATDQGDIAAKYDLALLLIHQEKVRNYSEAAKLLQQVVIDNPAELENYPVIHAQRKRSFSQAQAELGQLFRDGLGVPQNYEEALRLLRLASAQENADAQTSLGEMYEQGLGVAKNDANAFDLYIKAKGWNTRKDIHLAQMYEAGRGTKPNKDEALKHYIIAANDYNPQALAWLQKQAESGNPPAAYALGEMYRKGFGLGVDEKYSEAVKWYRVAAEHGDIQAQKDLGFIYQMCTWDNQGTRPEKACEGIKKHYDDAFFWLSVAAKSGDKEYDERSQIVAKELKPEQIAEIKKRVSEWQPIKN